ncbi:MAG: hypothetical protein GF341_13135, partial [candidate division Zixibacteria bacterium]|nr:hypothetical protein [candidate division Zixibacteria bacterium]
MFRQGKMRGCDPMQSGWLGFSITTKIIFIDDSSKSHPHGPTSTWWWLLLIAALLIVLMPPCTSAGPRDATTDPIFEKRFHRVNELGIVLQSDGLLRYCEFPRTVEHAYLAGAGLVFGCVRGNDTLVSESGYAELLSFTPIQRVSNRRGDSDYDPEARADGQFYVCVSDTSEIYRARTDPIDLRPHKPIGIEVHLTTYCWSSEFAKRFAIVDMWIVNISDRPIIDGRLGLGVTPNSVYSP